MSMTIGELINALLDVSADKHHLPVFINTDQTYNLPATYVSTYNLEPISEHNPFIIEHYED